MSYIISRGEVFYITSKYDTIGSEQRSGRPAVVVSNNLNNQHSETVEICYLTLQEKTSLPTHVKITSGACINSTILCEQITTISKERIGDYMCRLPDATMDEVDKALLVSLNLENMVETKSTYDYDYDGNKDEIAQYKAEAEALRIEKDDILKKYASLEAEMTYYSAKAARADLYEQMYNDLLDRLMKR